jgi:hypothetical protein
VPSISRARGMKHGSASVDVFIFYGDISDRISQNIPCNLWQSGTRNSHQYSWIVEFVCWPDVFIIILEWGCSKIDCRRNSFSPLVVVSNFTLTKRLAMIDDVMWGDT